MATGQKNSKGVVAAQRISVTTPVKGQCTAGFGGRGTRPAGHRHGRPPGSGTGGQRPPGAGTGNGGFGNSANFGFAFGRSPPRRATR